MGRCNCRSAIARERAIGESASRLDPFLVHPPPLATRVVTDAGPPFTLRGIALDTWRAVYKARDPERGPGGPRHGRRCGGAVGWCGERSGPLARRAALEFEATTELPAPRGFAHAQPLITKT